MPAMDYSRVAGLYDSYVTTDLDLDFFLDEAMRVGGPVLELMAGTGRVSIPLLQAAVDLTCVDNSPAMLSVFRDKLRQQRLSAELIQADVCELSLDRRFDLIFIPFHSFAEIKEPGRQRRALARIHAHLADDGRFICTLHNPSVRLQAADGRRRQLGEFPLPGAGKTLVLSIVERYDPAARVVTGTQFYEMRNSQGNTISEDAVDIRHYVHDRNGFEGLLENAGFVISSLFGDYRRASFESETSPFMIWDLSRKPADLKSE
jgi:SAM-dependent methyltransferase